MLIQKRELIQGKKSMILLMILDVLQTYTDEAHPMTKQELIAKINSLYGFMPARNNVYDKLKALIDAGFPIETAENGIFYDGRSLCDGELRFLADSVLYSDFVTYQGAADILKALKPLGSISFQSYLDRQIARTKKTRKNPENKVFMLLEDVLCALNEKKQISCNCLTFTKALQTERVYPESIVINPYDLAYKNGKYYLLGAQQGSDRISSWRVDRLCDAVVLPSRCIEIPLLKEIRENGGMSVYVDAQPDLCGGRIETFKLQVSDMAMDEIIDVFGNDFRLAPEQLTNPDPDIIYIVVRSTRDAVKAWAMMNTTKIIVIEPRDLRDEIRHTLYRANSYYYYAGKSLKMRSKIAPSLREAVRLVRMGGLTELSYHGMGTNHQCEVVETDVMQDLSQLEVIRLSNVQIQDTGFLRCFPNLKTLDLNGSDFPSEMLRNALQLKELEVSQWDSEIEECITDMKNLEALSIRHADITDLSFLKACPSLKRICLHVCEDITDLSPLTALPSLEEVFIDFCCGFTDFSVLGCVKTLRYLSVETIHFHYEDAVRLQAELPDCVIVTRGYNDDEYYE